MHTHNFMIRLTLHGVLAATSLGNPSSASQATVPALLVAAHAHHADMRSTQCRKSLTLSQFPNTLPVTMQPFDTFTCCNQRESRAVSKQSGDATDLYRQSSTAPKTKSRLVPACQPAQCLSTCRDSPSSSSRTTMCFRSVTSRPSTALHLHHVPSTPQTRGGATHYYLKKQMVDTRHVCQEHR